MPLRDSHWNNSNPYLTAYTQNIRNTNNCELLSIWPNEHHFDAATSSPDKSIENWRSNERHKVPQMPVERVHLFCPRIRWIELDAIQSQQVIGELVNSGRREQSDPKEAIPRLHDAHLPKIEEPLQDQEVETEREYQVWPRVHIQVLRGRSCKNLGEQNDWEALHESAHRIIYAKERGDGIVVLIVSVRIIAEIMVTESNEIKHLKGEQEDNRWKIQRGPDQVEWRIIKHDANRIRSEVIVNRIVVEIEIRIIDGHEGGGEGKEDIVQIEPHSKGFRVDFQLSLDIIFFAHRFPSLNRAEHQI